MYHISQKVLTKCKEFSVMPNCHNKNEIHNQYPFIYLPFINYLLFHLVLCLIQINVSFYARLCDIITPDWFLTVPIAHCDRNKTHILVKHMPSMDCKSLWIKASAICLNVILKSHCCTWLASLCYLNKNLSIWSIILGYITALHKRRWQVWGRRCARWV